MSEDEKRLIRGGLLLEIEDHEKTWKCLRRKVHVMHRDLVTAANVAQGLLQGGCSFTDGHLRTGSGIIVEPWPTLQELEETAKELAEVEAELASLKEQL